MGVCTQTSNRLVFGRRKPTRTSRYYYEFLAKIGKKEHVDFTLIDIPGFPAELKVNDSNTLILLDGVFRNMVAPGMMPGRWEFLRVMNMYGKLKDVVMMCEVWKTMVTYGVKPDVFLYNIAIRVYGQLEDFKMMQQTFDGMVTSGIDPNVYTYNSMIHLYGKCGNFERMENVFQDMIKSGVAPTEVTFHFMLMAYRKPLDLVKMDGIFSGMIEYGLKPLASSLLVGINGHGKLNNFQKVNDYMKMLQCDGKVLDFKYINQAISDTEVGGDLDFHKQECKRRINIIRDQMVKSKKIIPSVNEI